MPSVITVDVQGRPVGTMDKIAAHATPGTLHLAFSLMLFNRKGELLLQRRALSKYHFAGLWGNSCCGHPTPGAGLEQQAARRVEEELGLTVHEPVLGPSFTYRAVDAASGLIEYEVDRVIVASCDDQPHPDPAEVAAFAWIDPAELWTRLRSAPGAFVPWLPQVLTLSRTVPRR